MSPDEKSDVSPSTLMWRDLPLEDVYHWILVENDIRTMEDEQLARLANVADNYYAVERVRNVRYEFEGISNKWLERIALAQGKVAVKYLDQEGFRISGQWLQTTLEYLPGLTLTALTKEVGLKNSSTLSNIKADRSPASPEVSRKLVMTLANHLELDEVEKADFYREALPGYFE
jgi:hypothetical protein